MNFYKISKLQHKHTWNTIYDTKKNTMDEYLMLENDFIFTIKEFFDYFCTKSKIDYGCSMLAYNIIVHDCDLFYDGIHSDYDRLQELSYKNISYLNSSDVIFLLRCYIRNLCSLYLYDISSNSFLHPMDGDFYFYLGLHDNYDLTKIFSYRENVCFSVDDNHYSSWSANKKLKNLGDRIIW